MIDETTEAPKKTFFTFILNVHNGMFKLYRTGLYIAGFIKGSKAGLAGFIKGIDER